MASVALVAIAVVGRAGYVQYRKRHPKQSKSDSPTYVEYLGEEEQQQLPAYSLEHHEGDNSSSGDNDSEHETETFRQKAARKLHVSSSKKRSSDPAMGLKRDPVPREGLVVRAPEANVLGREGIYEKE